MPSDGASGLFAEEYLENEGLGQLKKPACRAYLGFYLRPGYVVSRSARRDFSSVFRQVKLLLGHP
jgi:hypothetical protein